MERLIHHNSSLSNTTVKWWPTDTQELYLKNLNDSTARQQLEHNGWINADITYQHNSHGFRTSEFEPGDYFVTVGCSLTFGTGVHQNQAWPELLSQRLGLKVYNLAIPGSAADTCYRVVEHYVPRLKPKFVVLLEPDSSRLEIFFDNKPTIHVPSNPDPHRFMNGQWLRAWYTSDHNMQTHSQKNVNAMAHVCQSSSADFYCYRSEFFPDFYSRIGGFARDLQHPGVKFHSALAEHIHNDIVNKRTYE